MNTSVIFYIITVIACLLVLVKSADLVEKAFDKLSKGLKINTFFLGFIILSIISSFPEMSVAIFSSNTIPELSIGNLFGATLVLITLFIGISVLKFGPIQFKGKFDEKEIIAALLILLVTPLLILDKHLSLVDGIISLGAYAVYAFHLSRVYKTPTIKEEYEEIKTAKVYKSILMALLGIGLLLFSASILVKTIILLGQEVQINDTIIGLFVLGIGTNTPELAILLRAKKASQKKLALGNFLGSACANIAILGLLAIMSKSGIPLKDFHTLIPVLALTFISVASFIIFSWTGHTLSRKEGYTLVFIYLAALITQLVFTVS